MLLVKEFKFDAAHNLVKYHGRCEKLHGHTYRLVITIDGVPDSEGMIIDFVYLKSIVEDNVVNMLDHSYLNDIIPQPTAENIALWVWKQIVNKINKENCKLHEVQVWETSTSGVVYRGEDI